MNNKSILIVFLLLPVFMSNGCRPYWSPREKRPPVLLKTASGIETTEFQIHDSILFDAINLSPRTGYNIQIVREDGEIITESRLSTDQLGRIPETVLWYDIGILPCLEVSAHKTAVRSFSDYDITDLKYAGHEYSLRILKDERLIRETPFRVAAEIIRPRLYAANWRGCPKTGFLIGEEDVWIVGKNFPKGSIIRVWAVPADTEWEDADQLKDMTKQYGTDLPPIFELKTYEDSFQKLLWPKALTSIGSYDIAAEVVAYPFGSYYATSTAEVQNIVSSLTYSGFVIQRRQGLGEPLEQNLAGTRMSKLAMRDTFLISEHVYAGVDPYIQPGYIGQTADVYIVDDKTDAEWTLDTNLTGEDVTGFVESVTIQPGNCANAYSTLAWTAPLTPGQYDVVLDFNSNGQYDHGSDLIDSLDLIGFTAAEVRVESISFNYIGSGAITIYDNVNTTNITAPEYSCGPCDDIKPAAWVMGGSYQVQVDFEADLSVNTAQIWAEGGLGGLDSSASPVTVNFVGGSGQGTFTVNNVPAFIGEHLFDWEWKYKNVNSIPSGTLEMGTTGEHILYTVLATPQAPQAQPWLGTLEVACDIASGRTTASDAMWDIWDDFYNNAGGLYDTVSGGARYASSSRGGTFNLTNWLNNYETSSIGIVNCYDMGKSVVIFANALGCGAVYTYVGPFGYLNCVRPIGRGWANNPFYNSNDYDDNPIVNEDSQNDWIPDNHAGRSLFGNHGFSRLGNDIYDASGGQVDVDANPDFGPPHTPRDLDGDDIWVNDYEDRVIDDNPPYSTGTPTNYGFTVH